MIRAFSVIAALTILTFAPLAALSYINAGTQVTGTIDRTLNSRDTQVNQTFLVKNAHSSNHDINGATIYGHVEAVQSAGQGTPGKLHLAVDKINTRSGNIYKLTGDVTNVQANTKSNAGREAGGGAAGALVGGLIGGGWGAIIGGTGGFLLAKNNRQNIEIPQGSLVTINIANARKVQ